MSDDENKPVRLVEDEATGDLFLVYATEKGLRLDIRFEGETLWMSQAQIAELFGRDISTISRHIANVFEEGELPEETSLQKVQTTLGRPSVVYTLDVVISVGYRVSSAQATLFRRWATGVLAQFAKKGFVVDTPRLKGAENAGRIAELREIIRDIRSDEANLYLELRTICALCQDYDGSTKTAREFFRRMQAKLVYAVTSHTPSEIIATRADHTAPGMGLQSWAGDRIVKKDATVSKNYLHEPEIKELNRLTSILLDIFEDQADLGRLVVMQDATTLMDKQLENLGRAVLRKGGSKSAEQAKQLAHAEYDQFDEQRKLERQREAKEQLNALAKEVNALPSSPREPRRKPSA